MVKDFEAFILRGNVVDLAVGVVIGAAFGAVVLSLVEDVHVEVSGSNIRYGEFVNALIAFLLVAAALFFLVVRPVNALMARRKTEPEVDQTVTDCPHCLSSIPASARVCAFRTRDV